LLKWRHLFKLDPDREIGDAALEAVCLSGTDAIIVGGTSGVTYDNTVGLLSRIRRFEVPCVLEVSDREAIVPGFDLYLVPVVLNTNRGEWIVGEQQRAIRRFGGMIPWEWIVPEGYVILNAESEAARKTGAVPPDGADDLKAYAEIAERLFSLPILYLEYSGRFGDMDLVRQVKRSLRHARLFYGGGIDDADKAVRAAQAADTIIVGNAVYGDLEAALTTVEAVKRPV
jgi:putative glycerol-1-phosphate prenyltransferase